MKNPSTFNGPRAEVLDYCLKENAAGTMSDDKFCAWVKKATKYEPFKLTVRDVEYGNTVKSSPAREEWVLMVPQEDPLHPIWQQVVLTCVTFWGHTWQSMFMHHWIPLPFKVFEAGFTRTDEMAKYHADMERCAHAVFEMCIEKWNVKMEVTVVGKPTIGADDAWRRRDIDGYIRALDQARGDRPKEEIRSLPY